MLPLEVMVHLGDIIGSLSLILRLTEAETVRANRGEEGELLLTIRIVAEEALERLRSGLHSDGSPS